MAEADAYNSCYISVASNPNRIWESDDVLIKQGPSLSLQIAIGVLASNFLYHILKPLNQPRIVAEILAGFLFSPLLLGRTKEMTTIFPTASILSIETYANLGLMTYAFVCGMEMNLDSILQVRKKATSMAIFGILIPMLIGMSFFNVIQKFYEEPTTHLKFLEDDKHKTKAYLFWSLVVTFTGFPMVAHILGNLKLLYTRIGKDALSAAMISDIFGWILFTTIIPFSSNNVKTLWSVMGTIIFVLLCIFLLRPLIARFIHKTIDQEKWDDSQLLFVLMGAFVFSYITDLLGTHSIVGAFVYGLILPHGRFTDFVMGKLENFVCGIMSPIFFFRSGVMVNLVRVAQQKYWPVMVLVMLFLSIPKVVSTLVASFFFDMPARDGVGIGLLLNSKGILALLVLNIARDRKILTEVAFSIMMCAIFLMTFTVPLFVNIIYRKQYNRYKLITIEKLRIDTELRVLTCIHNNSHAISMVNVLKATNATVISPLNVFGVHLVDATEHSTTLYATDMEHSTHSGAQNNLTRSQKELDSIYNTFNSLAEACIAIRFEAFKVVSDYETIHKDIFSLAEHKRTSLILLPFHKRQSVTGCLETTNEAYKDVNLNVLRDAPCSVAIFVDRGLGSLSNTNLNILMLFVGGPDDREALAVAWRMAKHPENQLSMVRIHLLGEAAEVDILANGENQNDEERQKMLDDEYVDSFRFKAVYNDDSITYSEEEVHNDEELTSLLHELDCDEYDLYIVGQGSGRSSMIFSKSLEWSDNPELGVVGDMLASNSFGTKSSILVVQQFGSGGLMFKQNPTKEDRCELLL
ncbi:cation/H(+) antiporter 15-like [Senna tora]|uniref:Cation/H(+) antiporter 15-like n=1 Tax=Senna tora TaxID=362788 RepID=A0A834XG97_9FABA|nr:cation/H(+) antiporter 15-like [Senna tora]